MKKLLTATALLAAFALTGCGNTDDAATDTPDTTDDTVSQTQGATTEEPPTDQSEEQEGSGDEEGMSDDEVIGIGDEFRVNTFDEDSTIYHWDVKVTGVETVDVLKNADDNEAYYSGDDVDAPEKVDAKPADGNEFVHVTYEQTNSSGVPAYLNIESQLVFSDGEVFAPLGDDGEYYTPNMTAQHELPAGESQNNDTTAKGDWVFEVPKGSEYDAVIVSEYAINAEEEYWVALK